MKLESEPVEVTIAERPDPQSLTETGRDETVVADPEPLSFPWSEDRFVAAQAVRRVVQESYADH